MENNKHNRYVWRAGILVFGLAVIMVCAQAPGIFISSSQAKSTPVRVRPQKKFVSGEILVKFKDNVSDTDRGAFVRGKKFTERDEIKGIKVKVLKVPKGSEEQVAEALSRD